MSRKPLRSIKGSVVSTRKKPKIEEVLYTPREKKIPLGLLSSDEEKRLYDIKLVDGTSAINEETIHEMSYLLKSIGFTETYNYLTSRIWNTSKEIILDAPTLAQARKNAKEEIIKSQEKFNAVEGIFTCPYCGSKRTIVVTLQLRSNDEPETVVSTCVDCKRQKVRG